jgi:hypothetical protein
MPRAKSFEHIPGFAINVLARLEAKKQVKEHLRAQGIRLTYPAREIVRATKRYLEAHPELYEEAMATAWALAAKDQQGRINAVLFDDDRRGWRKLRRPVSLSDNAKSATENTREKAQLVSD